MASYSLGIDIGGTFTDLVVYDHDSGRQLNRKVLTTHDDPARAVAAGVAALFRDGAVDPARVGRVVHATTLFTNALSERKGATTGLITTAGFADTLEIGRERKFDLYDIDIEAAAQRVLARHEDLGAHEQAITHDDDLKYGGLGAQNQAPRTQVSYSEPTISSRKFSRFLIIERIFSSLRSYR